MDSDETMLSGQLFNTLDDIGISQRIILLRRETALRKEGLMTVASLARKDDVVFHHFGSQSEGTTTLGMKSDVDMLFYPGDIKIVIETQLTEPGQTDFLLVKNKYTPPQQCFLEIIKTDEPILNMFTDYTGRTFYPNRVNKNFFQNINSDTDSKFEKCHGPSTSDSDDIDFVPALHCPSLPAECQTWMSRPRPGHWPTKEMIELAKNKGVFLLAQSHPFTENESVEWRMSPSLIERMFMFNLNEVQLKCYIVLKMIKKTYLKPDVGDHFTSFHLKTTMFFVVENTPDHIWRKNSLVKCIRLCIRTIQRWLKRGFCPHYFIPRMNLFLGKLSIYEMQKVSKILRDVQNNIKHYLLRISLDNLGDRLFCRLGGLREFEIQNVRQTSEINVAVSLSFGEYGEMQHLYNTFMSIFYEVILSCPLAAMIKMYDALRILQKLQKLYYKVDREKTSMHIIIGAATLCPHMCSHLACIQASHCCKYNKPLPRETLDLFRFSMLADAVSSRLKLASMYFCRGKLLPALLILCTVENSFKKHSTVAVCGCRLCSTWSNNDIKKLVLDFPRDDFIRSYVAFCVRFLQSESNCIPSYVAAEMYRTKTDVFEYEISLTNWMFMACIDSEPYLYYLLYHTYRGLGKSAKQVEALENLLRVVKQRACPGHPETAANLLAHCLQYENRIAEALFWYRYSLSKEPSDNAAKSLKWHIVVMLYNMFAAGKY